LGDVPRSGAGVYYLCGRNTKIQYMFSAHTSRCFCQQIALFMQTHRVVYANTLRCLCLQIALFMPTDRVVR